METFKVSNYEREHGPGTFPAYIQLDSLSSQAIRQQLAKSLGMASTSTGSEIVTEVYNRGKLVVGVSAESDTFDLSALVTQLQLEWTDKLYLNWYQFERIDEVQVEDMLAHFSDIWYPSVDDLEIFDRSMTWLLAISHYGVIKILRMNGE